MFPTGTSPSKRKYVSEYHDPDYNRSHSSSAKRSREDNTVSNHKNETSPNINMLNRVCELISREFQNEISLKRQQLEEIDQRLTKARNLLDRLRFAIVADFYRKQELPLSSANATTIRGKQTLFDEEPLGPQISLHPAVKKVIGKRPRNHFHNLECPIPERTAAQNAMNTIRSCSQSQRRQEKRLQKLIREQGLVIDHTKEPGAQIVEEVTVGIRTHLKNEEETFSKHNYIDTLGATNTNPKQKTHVSSVPATGKPLNTARLNNKTKQIIVIGNTSKYIGADGDGEPNQKSTCGNVLIYKWLVYVQSKDASTLLETFVKKIRFQLHTSYRPNDIVDVCSPPFQIARRGWGEFPMRIQLFFHEHLQQKPVQLIHNLVLDHSLSGMHTLGAETLMEVWLRTDGLSNQANSVKEVVAVAASGVHGVEETISKESIEVKESTPQKKGETNKETVLNDITTKPRTISFTQNKEEIDDNLFEFLNKSDEDITKIQPSVVVTEPLARISNNSPIKVLCKIPPSSEKTHNDNIVVSHNNPESSLAKVALDKNDSSSIKNDDSKVCDAKTLLLKQSTETQNSTLQRLILKENHSTDVKQCNIKESSSVNDSITAKVGKQTVNECGTIARRSNPMQITTPMIMRLPTSIPATKQTNGKNNGDYSQPLTNNNNIVSCRIGSLMPLKIANLTKLATATVTPVKSLQSPSSGGPVNGFSGKAVLQRKLVRLVDADGKVKYVQMLVATKQKTPNATHSVDETNANTNNETVTSAQAAVSTISLTTPTPISSISTVNVNLGNAAIDSAQSLKSITRMPTATVCNSINQVASINTSNTNVDTKTGGTSKQVVFQKEGKLFIIDPVQMRLKQQQRRQVSLLKPQLSLLKQQQPNQSHQNNQQRSPSEVYQSIVSDHDYTPSLITAFKSTLNATSIPSTTSAPQLAPTTPAIDLESLNVSKPQIYSMAPMLHLGIRQTRAKANNAFELLQQRRIQFEQRFLRRSVRSMRSAINYLLRCLPLIAHKDTSAAAFSFVHHSVQEFDELTVLKQRACEWLRSKYITRFMRNHKHLKELNVNGKECFWSTREVLLYARYHAFTPKMKSFKLSSVTVSPSEAEVEARIPQYQQSFSQLVKSEVKFEQQQFHYESITSHSRITTWLDRAWKNVLNYEESADCTKLIDVVSIDNEETVSKCGVKIADTSLKLEQTKNGSEKQLLYLPIPEHLEEPALLVSDICRDINIQLQPERIEESVVLPITQTLLAQCLNVFVEMLLRRTVAAQQKLDTEDLNITPQDIGKLLQMHSEFDFLRNANLGTYKCDRG